ncbi:hypothetical protein [Metabacillus fastidiosus]|uniref:hypothetical protein n=1 Tax=Metabacillus fastidiosus TaxID=1458 RepID=UPI002DC02EDE|nr:hypothetical protein [Metabacillus fastidiosus]MEC2078542.1 hypothetical protein [Metabacillus fastidiosus]
MGRLELNGDVYYVEVIPFEDKSEKDDTGQYEYYYKGKYLLFRSEKEMIRARIYDGEDVISFSKNPACIFGKDLEKLKEYLKEKYGVKKFGFLNKENSRLQLFLA